MLPAVLTKVHHWHWTRKESLKSKLLRASSEKKFCLQETVPLLNQCISKENHGWLETDKELKILRKAFKKQMKENKSLTLKLCPKKNHLMILKKMRSYLRKLEPEFWTYGLIYPLRPSRANVVFRPQTPKTWDVLTFFDFIGFI